MIYRLFPVAEHLAPFSRRQEDNDEEGEEPQEEVPREEEAQVPGQEEDPQEDHQKESQEGQDTYQEVTWPCPILHIFRLRCT